MGYVNDAGYTFEEARDSVGQGWWQLIGILWDAKPEGVIVTQVKEKFGELRFYVGGAPKEYHDLINKMTEVSLMVCEVCGSLGKWRDTSWNKALCDECLKHNHSSWRRPIIPVSMSEYRRLKAQGVDVQKPNQLDSGEEE